MLNLEVKELLLKLEALEEENEQLRQTIRLYEEQFVNVPKESDDIWVKD